MRIFELFADMLEYPSVQLPRVLHELISYLSCSGRDSSLAPECLAAARELVAQFRYRCDGMRLSRLEEIYTATFDLRADSSLSAGYHLFGDSWRRSSFLVQLKQRYRSAGFSLGTELPDHITTILRFLAHPASSNDARELVSECLIPTTTKILDGIRDSGNPYQCILEALLLCLRGMPVYEDAAAASANPPEGMI